MHRQIKVDIQDEHDRITSAGITGTVIQVFGVYVIALPKQYQETLKAIFDQPNYNEPAVPKVPPTNA